jgi:uncharacterized membrane protein YozB (DUF420 family)
MNFYSILLTLHGILALGLLVLIPASIGTSFASSDVRSGKVGLFTLIATHLQFVIGLVIYFTGTMGVKLFQVEGVMKD